LTFIEEKKVLVEVFDDQGMQRPQKKQNFKEKQEMFENHINICCVTCEMKYNQV